MITGSYPVYSRDYKNGGQVSSAIKSLLNKIGVAPDIIRRAMIAIFEAEMNIIIHSFGGEVVYRIDEKGIEIIAKDKGPGIPRIDLALQEGYSTASDEARELGFGAGMGLPNIKKNTDYFMISSSSTGTTLKFYLHFNSIGKFEEGKVYVTYDDTRCKRCLKCVTVCPTQAIRVNNGVSILSHRCINCNECIRICPTHVFELVPVLNKSPSSSDEQLVILPSPLLVFAISKVMWEEFSQKAKENGITFVPLLLAEIELRRKTLEYSKYISKFPIILPSCPAIVQIIQVEFPGLIENIAPFPTPTQIIIEKLIDEGKKNIVFIPSCPAQMSSALSIVGEGFDLVFLHPQKGMELVDDLNKKCGKKRLANQTIASKIKEEFDDTVVTITGLDMVRRYLDSMERNSLFPSDTQIVELYACLGGCFGFPFWDLDPTTAKLACKIFEKEAISSFEGFFEKVPYRVSNIYPRKGIRLDEDITIAVQKLSQIEKIHHTLPGRDCSVCGSPSCLTFAEDIVVRNADIYKCPYRNV